MLPQPFLDRMKHMLGEEFESFFSSFEREKYQALRLNPLKTKGEGRELKNMPFPFTNVPWEKNGYYYEKQSQPGKHSYHAAGVYYIQEPSAMAPVSILKIKPGERVLDLCAAPGGKSTQIAAALQGEGFLICNEIHPTRAKILSENVERMGIVNAVVTNETPAQLSEIFQEYFDCILVDAPCSGEGMFRKNEEACREWSLKNVELCAARQDEILEYASKMLRPGGRLVYSTCTFAPLENEGSISRFLAAHDEFKLLSIDKTNFLMDLKSSENTILSEKIPKEDFLQEKNFSKENSQKGDYPQEKNFSKENNQKEDYPQEKNFSKENNQKEDYPQEKNFLKEDVQKENYVSNLCCEDGISQWVENPAPNLSYTLRLWPNRIKGEGHYVALLQKKGSISEGYQSIARSGIEKGISQKELGEYLQFCKETFTQKGLEKYLNPKKGSFLRFGDNIYLIPQDMPGIKGLKVLRPGLQLGTLKKNRFEPSHALALALSPEEVIHIWNLNSAENMVNAYLNGQTFSAEGEKGWYLICVDGFSLGWGKLAGGSMKNHYPKGLRKNE